MGNQLAASGSAAAVNLSDISDNVKNLQLVAPLGGVKRGRLFTSLHCRQLPSTTDVVIKVFVQRAEDRAQAVAINNHQDQLQLLEVQLRRYYKENPDAPCNLLFYTVRSRHGGYCLLQRPYIHYSIAERLQMRPFWEPCQRLFICYQLLQSLVQLHDGCRSAHGDLKPENVLISSQDWLYITDFCPFKPPLLPTNNPANFEFFYDNAETRNCCCAPEKFSDHVNAGGGGASGGGGSAPNTSATMSTPIHTHTSMMSHNGSMASPSASAAMDGSSGVAAASPSLSGATPRHHSYGGVGGPSSVAAAPPLRLGASTHRQTSSAGEEHTASSAPAAAAATPSYPPANSIHGNGLLGGTAGISNQYHLASSDVFAAACIIVFIMTDEPMFKLSGALEFTAKTPSQRRAFLMKIFKQRKLNEFDLSPPGEDTNANAMGSGGGAEAPAGASAATTPSTAAPAPSSSPSSAQRGLTVGDALCEMLCTIMCCDAAERPSASSILKAYCPRVFPHSFGFLYNNVIPAMQQKAPDAQVHFLYNRFTDILQTADRCDLSAEALALAGAGGGGGEGPSAEGAALLIGSESQRAFVEEVSMSVHQYARHVKAKEKLRLAAVTQQQQAQQARSGVAAQTAATAPLLAAVNPSPLPPSSGGSALVATASLSSEFSLVKASDAATDDAGGGGGAMSRGDSSFNTSPLPQQHSMNIDNPLSLHTGGGAGDMLSPSSSSALPPPHSSTSVTIPANPVARRTTITLLLPYLTSVLRYVRSVDARCRALLIMRRWVPWASERGRRDIILPWGRQVLQSRRAGLQARVQAVRTLREVLLSLPNLSTNEAFLFEDYILDVFETLLREPGVLAPQATNSALPTASTVEGVLMLQPMLSLLTEMATCLPSMLLVGCSYVRQRQKLYARITANSSTSATKQSKGAKKRKAAERGATTINLSSDDEDDDDADDDWGSGGGGGGASSSSAYASFDNELREVVDRGWEVLKVLLSTNQSAVAVAALKQTKSLCHVLGQERVTSELLPILTTFLSSTAVEVKAEFLRQVPFLGAFLHGAVVAGAGGIGVNAPASFLSMVIEDGLRQVDVSCICAALESTCTVASTRVVPTEILMPVINTALRHLHSPNTWVQEAACVLVEAVAQQYAPSDLLLHVARPMLGRLKRPIPLVALRQHKDALKAYWELPEYAGGGRGSGAANGAPAFVDPYSSSCYASSPTTNAPPSAGAAGPSGGADAGAPANPYPWSNHPGGGGGGNGSLTVGADSSDVAALLAASPYAALVSNPQPPCADFMAAVYDPSRILAVGGEPVKVADEAPMVTSHADVYAPIVPTGASAGGGSAKSNRSVSVAPSMATNANFNGVGGGAGGSHPAAGGAGSSAATTAALLEAGAAAGGASSLITGSNAASVVQRLMQSYEGFVISVQREEAVVVAKRERREAKRRAQSVPVYRRLASGDDTTLFTAQEGSSVVGGQPSNKRGGGDSSSNNRKGTATSSSTAATAKGLLIQPWRMTDFKATERQRKRIEVRNAAYHGTDAYGESLTTPANTAASSMMPSSSSYQGNKTSRSFSALTVRSSTTTAASGGVGSGGGQQQHSLFSQWDQQNVSALGGLNTNTTTTVVGAGATRASVFGESSAATDRSFGPHSTMTRTSAASSSMATPNSMGPQSLSGGVGGNSTTAGSFASSSASAQQQAVAPLRPMAAPLATFHGPAWDENSASITCMSAGGSWLVTGGTKGTVTLWDTDVLLSCKRFVPRHYRGLVPSTESLLFAQFTYNMNSPIVLGATDSTLRLFDPQTEAVYATHTYPEEGGMSVCTRLTPNVTLVGSHSGSLFAVDWRMRAPSVWRTQLALGEGAATTLLSLHHLVGGGGSGSSSSSGLGVASASGDPTMGDPYACVAGTTEGFISLYDLRFRLNVKSFAAASAPTASSVYGHSSGAGAQRGYSAVSPPHSYGSSGVASTRSSAFNHATGQSGPSGGGGGGGASGINSRVSVVAMCQDPRTTYRTDSGTSPAVIVSTSDGQLQRFDLQTGDRTLQLRTLSPTVTRSLLHVPRTPIVLTGSEDRLIRLWDFANPASSRTLACLPQRSGPYDYNIRTNVFSEGDPFAPPPNNSTAAGNNNPASIKNATAAAAQQSAATTNNFNRAAFGGSRPYGVTTLNYSNSTINGGNNSNGRMDGGGGGGIGSCTSARYFAGNGASSASGTYSSGNGPIDPHHSDHITAMAVIVHRGAQYLTSASRDGVLRVWSNQPPPKAKSSRGGGEEYY